MREIKFRVWDGSKMIYFDNPHICDEYSHLAFSTNDYLSGNYDDEKNAINNIMQFTGLRDKNGKDIYEGDIITFKEWNGEIKRRYIEYDSGGFYPFADEQDNAPYPKPNECEIIGNIHENTELLK